jgi:hypothetical protein
MAQRLGMADGRCATINVSSRLFNDEIFKKSAGDNSSFSHRMYLQRSSPEDVIPAATCALFSYKDSDVKDSASIRESTNVISQLENRD